MINVDHLFKNSKKFFVYIVVFYYIIPLFSIYFMYRSGMLDSEYHVYVGLFFSIITSTFVLLVNFVISYFCGVRKNHLFLIVMLWNLFSSINILYIGHQYKSPISLISFILQIPFWGFHTAFTFLIGKSFFPFRFITVLLFVLLCVTYCIGYLHKAP